MSEELASSDSITMQLVKRRITWGEAAREKQDMTVMYRQKLLQAGQQINSQLAAANQAELQQRAQQQQQQQQWLVQQQIINSMNQRRMTNTNCDIYGNSLSCQSY